MTDRKPERLLRRAALGFWFCAIAALGLLQSHRHAFPDGQFAPDLIAWLWLGGSAILAVLGIGIIVREIRRPG